MGPASESTHKCNEHDDGGILRRRHQVHGLTRATKHKQQQQSTQHSGHDDIIARHTPAAPVYHRLSSPVLETG
eukprot:13703795-Alexandrium_andersonii.AAC.1